MPNSRKRKWQKSTGDSNRESKKPKRVHESHKHGAANDRRRDQRTLQIVELPPEPPSEVSSEKMEVETKKRPRHKCRYRKLQQDTANLMVKALRSDPPLIGHLFGKRDENGTPMAPFKEVVAALDLEKCLLQLSAAVVTGIAQYSQHFDIEEEEGDFYVKYRPVDTDVAVCTVYVDRLPARTTRRLLERLASKFGRVVEIRHPKKARPQPPPEAGFIRRPQTLSFAFIQMSSSEEAAAFCKNYEFNAPSEERHCRWFFYRGRRRHLREFCTRREAIKAFVERRDRRIWWKTEKNNQKKLKIREWRRRRKAIRAMRIMQRRREERQREMLAIRERRARRRKEHREKMEKKRKAKESVPVNGQEELKNGLAMEDNSEGIGMATPTKQQRRKKKMKKRRKSITKADTKVDGSATSTPQSTPQKLMAIRLVKVPSKFGSGSRGRNSSVPLYGPEPPPKAPARKKGRRGKRVGLRGTVANFFQDVQVIPFAKYIELRHEYIAMRDQKVKEAKKEIPSSVEKGGPTKLVDFRDTVWKIEEDSPVTNETH